MSRTRSKFKSKFSMFSMCDLDVLFLSEVADEIYFFHSSIKS